MTAPVLELRASRLGYPHRAPVLHDLEVEIGVGERVALVGGNGAGKTTLLKACVRLLSGSLVELRLLGRPVRKALDAVAAGAGLVFQNPDDQLFGATVFEDVASGPRNQGLSESEVTRRVSEALARVGISTLAARAVDSLSFGEKKRACLAGILAMRPRLLLLDEPTAGLDPAAESALVSHLNELSRDLGITVICATHSMDLVPYLADRVLVLGSGRVLVDGTVADVLTRGDTLARSGLRSPTVTRLAQALNWKTWPLTIEEAERAWNERLS